ALELDGLAELPPHLLRRGLSRVEQVQRAHRTPSLTGIRSLPPAGSPHPVAGCFPHPTDRGDEIEHMFDRSPVKRAPAFASSPGRHGCLRGRNVVRWTGDQGTGASARPVRTGRPRRPAHRSAARLRLRDGLPAQHRAPPARGVARTRRRARRARRRLARRGGFPPGDRLRLRRWARPVVVRGGAPRPRRGRSRGPALVAGLLRAHRAARPPGRAGPRAGRGVAARAARRRPERPGAAVHPRVRVRGTRPGVAALPAGGLHRRAAPAPLHRRRPPLRGAGPAPPPAPAPLSRAWPCWAVLGRPGPSWAVRTTPTVRARVRGGPVPVWHDAPVPTSRRIPLLLGLLLAAFALGGCARVQAALAVQPDDTVTGQIVVATP